MYFICIVLANKHRTNLCSTRTHSCGQQVSSIWDERNFGTFAAYGTLVALWLYALWKPRARRSLSEALTWGCLPFVPASGVLARLGTLLAERLLYLPSIGYCLLLGWLINATEEITVIPEDTSATPGSASSNENTTAASPTGNGTPVKLSPPRDTSQNRRHNSNNTSSKDHVKKRRLVAVRALAWVGVGLLAQRTRQRIPDWATDWTLFHAAQEACPTSAKTRHQVRRLVFCICVKMYWNFDLWYLLASPGTFSFAFTVSQFFYDLSKDIAPSVSLRTFSLLCLFLFLLSCSLYIMLAFLIRSGNCGSTSARTLP